MRKRTWALIATAAVVGLGGGAVVTSRSISIPTAEQTTPSTTGAATVQIARKTLVATTQVDGTLGYAGSYTVANAFATSAGGGGGGDAQQAYASARSQYDQAAATLDALRHPASADLLELRAQLAQAAAGVAQAAATLRNDQPATSAQARRRVAVDEAQLSAARAAESAARAALTARQQPTSAQIRQAQDAVTAAKAALDAASAGLEQPRGVLTQVAAVGSTVRPGQTLFTLDGDHPAVLMAGGVPAWRDIASGIADGTDIEQLETDLRALGFAPEGMSVDGHWDADTTAAVKAWQKALGAPQTGAVTLGTIVFEPTALRVTADGASLGATVQQGTTVLQATSTTPVVTVALDPALQTKVHAGDAVSITMPDGSGATGAVSEVGTVATAPGGNQPGANATPTIDVTVTLDDPSSTGGLDLAPVSVNITTATADNVLAVPVSALVELLEGGYAVQVRGDDGTLHYSRVQLGLFANGWVEVTGQGLTEGQTVVVAQ